MKHHLLVKNVMVIHVKVPLVFGRLHPDIVNKRKEKKIARGRGFLTYDNTRNVDVLNESHDLHLTLLKKH